MGKKKTKLTLEKKYNLTGWAFLLPAAILIFVFCFYPMAQAILLSFRKTGGVFTGLSNYTRVFQDKTFQQCLFNTFFYFLIQVPIMLVLALILAQLLNSPKIRCKGLFRTLIFLPCATSLVSYSITITQRAGHVLWNQSTEDNPIPVRTLFTTPSGANKDLKIIE